MMNIKQLAFHSAFLLAGDFRGRFCVEDEAARGGEVAHAMLFQAREHAYENLCGSTRVVGRAVAIEDRDRKMLGDGVQPVIQESGKDAARELDRAEVRINHAAARK